MAQVGARVKIKWTTEEIGDSGWKPGWYTAIVQSHYDDSDSIVVMYPSEPNCTYTVGLTSSYMAKKLKLIQGVL